MFQICERKKDMYQICENYKVCKFTAQLTSIPNPNELNILEENVIYLKAIF